MHTSHIQQLPLQEEGQTCTVSETCPGQLSGSTV